MYQTNYLSEYSVVFLRGVFRKEVFDITFQVRVSCFVLSEGGLRATSDMEIYTIWTYVRISVHTRSKTLSQSWHQVEIIFMAFVFICLWRNNLSNTVVLRWLFVVIPFVTGEAGGACLCVPWKYLLSSTGRARRIWRHWSWLLVVYYHTHPTSWLFKHLSLWCCLPWGRPFMLNVDFVCCRIWKSSRECSSAFWSSGCSSLHVTEILEFLVLVQYP